MNNSKNKLITNKIDKTKRMFMNNKASLMIVISFNRKSNKMKNINKNNSQMLILKMLNISWI